MKELPLGLKHALEAGDCVLFIGSGVGRYLKKPDGSEAPDGESLAKELASFFDIDPQDENDLTKISKIVEIRKRSRRELMAFLRNRLSELQPDATIQWLCSIRWRAIFTTNYDRGIQRAYELTASPAQNFKTITATSNIVSIDSRFDVPIYHLHGALFESESPEIIITEDDYAVFRERRRMLFELLKKEFITSTILYVGYSNRDPNWKIVQREIASEFYPSVMPVSYRVVPHTTQMDREILLSNNIHSLDMDLEEFMALASTSLSITDEDRERLKRLRREVPTDLGASFDKNPVAVTRLLASWTYVNQAPFSDRSNVKIFLQGDRPNWALIAAHHYFDRNIEEEIYDDLLDYATSGVETANVRILLAPAGYGVSTVLMSLAVRLIKEKAGPVFMLKPGCCLLEGDIEFASTLFAQRPFFFVDTASDHIENLQTIIQRFREGKISGMFLLGERLNEWRQNVGALRGKEFMIEPLSDVEINKLLDFLGEQSALNKIESLPREMQFSAIKKNYSKELLVAMREATEGKDFDIILVDEYRGIGDDTSRLAYLIVCCFFQHGTHIRETLLSDILEKSLVEYYEATSRTTEGVILYDTIDESKGLNAARARHRTIASVVWDLCGSPEEKERILKMALENLNLNYPSDSKAFESFYRSDRVVDAIRSLGGKIDFFEKSCKKDPISTYVRQHYARMLMRENKLELALAQINSAIEMDNKVRVLYHTKGLILSKMAMETESADLARRRLIQGEGVFTQGISLAYKDNYCYQGLAELYLGWAKRCDSENEATDYIAKAEEVINRGLREVRVRDGLWIVSANVQMFLGNNPGYLNALEKAVLTTPGSIVARYLLGRAYRKKGRMQEAVDILKPVVVNYPEEYRSHVEYAIVLYHIGKSYGECIAVLQQSTLYGNRDPRFIATLGGMLFMNSAFSEAEKVFDESNKRNFTVTELNTIQFRPIDRKHLDQPYKVRGRVQTVKAGYAWIESEGFPKPFLCPGSKFRGLLMQTGLRLIFEIAFNARGPIADNPKIDNGV
jgi:tetratricopeptide (TPR) repeat protein